MKMNTSKSKLTINPENLGDVLELTDADLVQIQGGCGSDYTNWEVNSCNYGRPSYHRHDYDDHRHDYNDYHHHSSHGCDSRSHCGRH